MSGEKSNNNSVNSGKQRPGMTLIENWAIWIVGICIICLLLGVGCFVVNKTVLTPKVSHVIIKVIPDTISAESTYSKKEVDSLITITKSTLESYEHHFETETVQKEQEDVYKSFGSLLLSIIVGLCGFFGFKSFKDIKDKGEQTARDVACKEARDVAEKKAAKAAEDYLESKLPEVVEKQFEKSFKGTTVDSIKESLKAEIVPYILQQIQNDTEKDSEAEETPVRGEAEVAPMTPEEMFDQQPQNE